jgi:serine/threonine-protein kinase RsbW
LEKPSVAQQVHTGRLKLASRFEEVARAHDAIITAAEEHGYDQSQVFGIKLALEEALTNAIKHGNAFDESKFVHVEYEVDSERLKVTVCDEGPGFHPETVPDPTLDENLNRPCGRGVMLMQCYMTDVSFNEAGTCVTMVKRRDCRLPQG